MNDAGSDQNRPTGEDERMERQAGPLPRAAEGSSAEARARQAENANGTPETGRAGLAGFARRVRGNAKPLGTLHGAFDRGTIRSWVSDRFWGPLTLREKVLLYLIGVLLLMVVIDPLAPVLFDAQPRWMHDFFQFVTDLGKSHWMLWSTGLVVLASLAMDWSAKGRLQTLAHRAVLPASFIFASVSICGLTTVVLKQIIGRGRPRVFEDYGVITFDPFTFGSTYASFPSGHSTNIAAFTMAVAIMRPSWRWPMVGVALLIGFSRIMVSAHYFSDIAAGLAVGSVGTVFVARWFRKAGYSPFAILESKGR